jgi:hypothetical protein
MRIDTTDLISGNTVKDIEKSPFVIEGNENSGLKIYFESEENKKAYLEIETEHPGKDFTTNLDNPV